MIWVGLIGRPKQGAVFTRVKEEEWEVWDQKLKALGDPYLGLERLMAEKDERPGKRRLRHRTSR